MLIDMNFHDFLKFGKELIQEKDIPEVKIRTSVSRVYNYVFHYIRENYREHPDSDFTNGKGDHQEAIGFLKRLEERRLASALEALTNKRNNVEYTLKLSFTKGYAIDYIDDAEDFVIRIDKEHLKSRRVKERMKKRWRK